LRAHNNFTKVDIFFLHKNFLKDFYKQKERKARLPF